MLGYAANFIGWTSSKPKHPVTPANSAYVGGRRERVFSSQTTEVVDEQQEQWVRDAGWESFLVNQDRELEAATAMRRQMDTPSTDENLAQLEQWQREFERSAWRHTSSSATDRKLNSWTERIKWLPVVIIQQFRRLLPSPGTSPSASRENSWGTNGSLR